MPEDLDDKLGRMCADGRISQGDADEVRNFVSFLRAAPAPSERSTPEGRQRFIEAYREHYPEEYAKAIAEQQAREGDR